MKQLTQAQQKFIESRALSGKSLYSLSRELNTPIDKLLDWDDLFMDDIESIRQRTMDKIREENETSLISVYKYLSQTYVRLRAELNKRDFSGLPTDKLFYMMNHVREILNDLEQYDINDHLPSMPDFLDDEDDDY